MYIRIRFSQFAEHEHFSFKPFRLPFWNKGTSLLKTNDQENRNITKKSMQYLLKINLLFLKSASVEARNMNCLRLNNSFIYSC